MEEKLNESSTQNPGKNAKTGLSTWMNYFANECCTEWHMDRIGRKGISDFGILGNPYTLGFCEPIERINS